MPLTYLFFKLKWEYEKKATYNTELVILKKKTVMKYVDKFHLYTKNARLIILFLLIAICRTTARTRNKLAKKDMTEKQVIITAIGQCAGDEGLPVNVVPMDIIREGRFDYFIDGVVLFREDFDDGFKSLFISLFLKVKKIDFII